MDTETLNIAQRRTKAFSKLLTYVDTLKSNSEFKQELKWFRKHRVNTKTNIPIPENGLPLPKKTIGVFQEDTHYDYLFDEKTGDYVNFEEYKDREDIFKKRYGLEFFDDAFEFLVLYNSLEPYKEWGFLRFADVVDMRDLAQKRITPNTKFTAESEMSLRIKYLSKTTPIGILINPYMSERDILEFIKEVYKTTIKPMQEVYKKDNVKLGDVRKKSEKKQKRNAFIYEHRDLPVEELLSLVNKQFHNILEYTHIQKIIRDEKQKRK